MAETKSVGIWILIGVDALFWASLLFLYARVRGGVEDWPDILPAAVASPLFPLLFLGGLTAAALLGNRPPLAFLVLLASLSMLGCFWFQAAERGLTPRAGRYGNLVYLTTILLGVHALGALVAAGIALGGDDRPRFLRRFLVFLAGVGAVVVLALFVV